jgi:hypothetical protein
MRLFAITRIPKHLLSARVVAPVLIERCWFNTDDH